MKYLSCRHFSGELAQCIQNECSGILTVFQVGDQLLVMASLIFGGRVKPFIFIHAVHFACKSSNLRTNNHHSHGTVAWQSNKRENFFISPRVSLLEFQGQLCVVVHTEVHTRTLKIFQRANNDRFNFDNSSLERSCCDVGAVNSLLVLTTRFGGGNPYSSDQSSNSPDGANPCPPIGRGQTRPVDPLVPAQSEGRTEHDCTEFVVPGLKPSSDLGEHRSSAKYLRDRTTARLRGYSAALPSTRAVIRPNVGEARPPRERRRYLDSGIE